MIFFFILVLLALLICLLWPITTLIHEIGHAIPALLFTRKKVTLYIGSYGDPDKSARINLGFLEIWFRYNPLHWQRGLCRHAPVANSTFKEILIVLCGPLASFILGICSLYFSFHFYSHGLVKLILIVFVGLAIFDLLINLIPSSKPILLYDGATAYNDGYSLILVLRYSKLVKKYNKANACYDNQKFEEASVLYDDIIDQGAENIEIFRLAAAANINARKYQNALSVLNKMKELHAFEADDYSNFGFSQAYLNQRDESIDSFKQSLLLNPDNYYTLNNRGFFLAEWERYEEALVDLNRCISINPDYSNPYDTRGLAKIKTGDISGGLADINYALQLDPNNAYAHKGLAIYYMDIGNRQSALEHLDKAKSLDQAIYNIDGVSSKILSMKEKNTKG